MKIEMSLSTKSIDNALKMVRDHRKRLVDGSARLIQELAESGLKTARAEFSVAEYDGTNDVKVHIERRGEHETAIVAIGQSALFIEFGTGIAFPNSHPEAAEQGFIHGTYGYGLGGMEDGWRYPVEKGQGTNGEVDEKHPGFYHTRGNKANMCMYNTKKELEAMIYEKAREIFDA